MAEYGMGWILMHVLIELGACVVKWLGSCQVNRNR